VAERQWVVFRPRSERRWGGELRRHYIFAELAIETEARVIHYWRQLERLDGRCPLSVMRRRRPRGRPWFVSSEQPPARAFEAIRRLTQPLAVAIYDDPVAQSEALGVDLGDDRKAELQARLRESIAGFALYVVPTSAFADLVSLDSSRVIVAGNGTDTARIAPGPMPADPTVGFVSGAAPGRGIETLVAAVRELRATGLPVRLRLWLVATSQSSERYLADLRVALAGEGWVTIESAPYERLGHALAGATVLCVPHPPSPYMDAALPVKLLDSMAAGRPLVVTPRTETAAIIRRHGAGIVAGGDRPEDLAAALLEVLSDAALAQRLGAAGRRAAELHYDWQIVGKRLAHELIARTS